MEELMYYVWQQRLFRSIETIDGLPVDIIHPGLRNHLAGPDFFNAKVRYDGIIWAGNVEMHVKASDWFRHHHHENQIYDSVVLHVVLEADAQVYQKDGSELKTVVMHIPDDVLKRYYSLCSPTANHDTAVPLLPGQTPAYSGISCCPRIKEIPDIILEDWISALSTQRLAVKKNRAKLLIDEKKKSWDECFYIILLRSLGTGTNSDAMERLARSLPYSCLLHHRDDLLQIRALLLGQAGLIADNMSDAKALTQEYNFLRNKFSLTPLPASAWKMSRFRPNAAPHLRLEAFAAIIYAHPNLFSQTLEAHTLDKLEKMFIVKGIGKQTAQVLIINAIIPTLLQYFEWQDNEERYTQTVDLLDAIPPEHNHYIKKWEESGIPVHSAYDSQALLQLYQNYCQPHKCLNCRIGCWLIKNPPKN